MMISGSNRFVWCTGVITVKRDANLIIMKPISAAPTSISILQHLIAASPTRGFSAHHLDQAAQNNEHSASCYTRKPQAFTVLRH